MIFRKSKQERPAMADNKPYISLDEELEIEHKPINSGSGNVFMGGKAAVEEYAPPVKAVEEIKEVEMTRPMGEANSEKAALEETLSAIGGGSVSVATDEKEAMIGSNLSPLEQEMLEVAIKNYNSQRDKAHQEIDQVYDKMIQVTEGKIRGLTKDVAAEVGM